MIAPNLVEIVAEALVDAPSDDAARRQARDVLAALREATERALFDIEGIHHFHGNQCLCGFESARSRSRTEHITGAIRAVLPWTVVAQ